MIALFVNGPLHGQIRKVAHYGNFNVAGDRYYAPRFFVMAAEPNVWRKVEFWVYVGQEATPEQMIDAMGRALGISTEDTRI